MSKDKKIQQLESEIKRLEEVMKLYHIKSIVIHRLVHFFGYTKIDELYLHIVEGKSYEEIKNSAECLDYVYYKDLHTIM